MPDADERMRILKMIEDHKVTAEEGARLLSALGDPGNAAGRGGASRGGGTGKWLRIRVTDIASGRSKASVQIPVGLLDAGMKIGAHFAPEVEGIDMTHVLDAIRAGATGKIIDVMNDTQGEHVEIFVD